jgi:hypothetical protein
MSSRVTAYTVLLGKPEGRTLHRRPIHRWEDNIKMDKDGINWIIWLRTGQSGRFL